MISILLAAALLAPVTQEEAVAFHTAGLCQMSEPGKGITRADGDGWVVSPLPGMHSFFAKGGSTSARMMDMTPGYPQKIKLSPGATLYWCPKYTPPGRDACGPVPPAFLYDAKKIGDPQ